MLDINYIIKNQEQVRDAISKKGVDLDIDELIKVNEEKNSAQKEVDDLREERNKLSHKFNKEKPTPKNIERGKEIKKKITEKESILQKKEEKFRSLMLKVPNIISKEVPIGADENENVVVRKVGEPREFDFKPKDHMELGEALGIIDTQKSALISGARFNYLFGDAVMLQFALIQFVFHTLTNKDTIAKLADSVGNPFKTPFNPVLPPVIAKSKIMKKMDRFDPIEDRYYLEQDDSLLIGSAEHTLGPLHINETLEEGNLPIRYIGYSTAFRREAGSYGKDTAGILRRHQFDKAEMETFVPSEYGLVEQDLIVAIQEYLVKSLEIPYQVVAICTGDMGKPDYRQIDIECFLPGQNKYRETHTSDFMSDFQSRRLNIKYKTKTGEKKLAHMNDATAFAMGRILIAIMENNQQKDGSIVIPEVLRKYFPDNKNTIQVK